VKTRVRLRSDPDHCVTKRLICRTQNGDTGTLRDRDVTKQQMHPTTARQPELLEETELQTQQAGPKEKNFADSDPVKTVLSFDTVPTSLGRCYNCVNTDQGMFYARHRTHTIASFS
jgi:hypothetical protein